MICQQLTQDRPKILICRLTCATETGYFCGLSQDSSATLCLHPELAMALPYRIFAIFKGRPEIFEIDMGLCR